MPLLKYPQWCAYVVVQENGMACYCRVAFLHYSAGGFSVPIPSIYVMVRFRTSESAAEFRFELSY